MGRASSNYIVMQAGMTTRLSPPIHFPFAVKIARRMFQAVTCGDGSNVSHGL